MSESTIRDIALAIERMGSLPPLEAIGGLREFFHPHVDNAFGSRGRLPFKALVFNMECGTRLDLILPYLQHHRDLHGADIILANELDWGMARSGNRNIAGEIAAALEMNYAFVSEFISVRAGRDGNREGWHGNAIFSRFPLENVRVLRLPIIYDWFHRQNDQRLGGRVALLAEIQSQGCRIGLVCLHLENRATPEARDTQLRFVLEQAARVFPDLPVLIGGDMNTNTVDGDAPDGMAALEGNPSEQARRMANIPAFEPLMASAKAWGCSYEDCNLLDKPTRRKHMPGGQDILLNLDWFFQKGLYCRDPRRVETIFSHLDLMGDAGRFAALDGQEMSDHDAVAITCSRQEKAAHANGGGLTK
ncbi:MAG: endonuclease/exonuclease/phosphatase family protein [Christensenellales bacterium]